MMRKFDEMAGLHTISSELLHSLDTLPLPTAIFLPLYGNAPVAVHPKFPELPEATGIPFSTVNAHRFDATQYGISL